MSNYEALIRDNLAAAFEGGQEALATRLPAAEEEDVLVFRAFGEACRVAPDGVRISGRPETGPRGLVVSLYAANAASEPMRLEPLIAYRDIPGTMPYQGAFSANSERPLVSRALAMETHRDLLCQILGHAAPLPSGTPGDLALLLVPLPKIALCYIVYLPDDEFPASVTCLFSNNAPSFMPLDGLADTAEYTTRKILDLIAEASI